MEKITNWFKLWEELSQIQAAAFTRQKKDKDQDFWKDRAKAFDKMVDQRWAKPDSSRDFLVTTLKNNPGSSLLDIGAGTGKWSLLAAPYAGQITALEPSKAMQSVLREKIKNTDNISILDSTWPDPKIKAHDWILASHSMYGQRDFKAFVSQMNTSAKKGCILVLRAPFADSLMSQASTRVLGQPYDSPNFQVAYNCLLAMDIYPDVIMEDADAWQVWSHDTLALAEVKNRLGIQDEPCHDDYLSGLLDAHLIQKQDQWVWPQGNRSALVHWQVSQ
ncbi:MAG: methyltransferase domain-containing protein [Desulfobacter sp.]|nr:methyltransferase domain-containing protein [Desulfobacter sp.]